MITLTAKIQIFPSEEEKELLLGTTRQYAKACNFISGHVFRTHDLSQPSLNKQLYHELRETYMLKAQMA